MAEFNEYNSLKSPEWEKDFFDKAIVTIKITNYRCFSQERPLRLELKPGSVAFLGVNNSGKSTILKFFWEFRGLFEALLMRDNLERIADGHPLHSVRRKEISDWESLFNNENMQPIIVDISITYKPTVQDKRFYPRRIQARIPREIDYNTVINLFTENGNTPPYRPSESGKKFRLDEICQVLIDNKLELDLQPVVALMNILRRCFYIGAFRTTEGLMAREENYSEKPIRYFDILLGSDFVEGWNDLKTRDENKTNEIAFQIQDDIKQLFKIDEMEINSSADKTHLKVRINSKSYRLDELGSGIAQFIQVFASCAVSNPSFILIDEPELNLHPSLQLSFLTALASYSEYGIMFCTHSYGLARSAAERQFALHRKSLVEPPIVKPLELFRNLPEMLGELSYASYRELGFDKILLVEGPTEILAIQQLLRLYGLDHKVVMLSLGGNDFINRSRKQELEEIKRISDNIHALIDSEKKSSEMKIPGNRLAFQKMCMNKKTGIGINCHILKRKALENYFPQHAISKGVTDRFKKLKHYEKHDKENYPDKYWDKNNNWKITRHMTLDDLNNDLGGFLKSLEQ